MPAASAPTLNTIEQGAEHNPQENADPPNPTLPPNQELATPPSPDISPPPEIDISLVEPRRSGRDRHSPNFLAFLAADQVIIPKNEKEALSSPQAKEWKAAMQEELAALAEMNTWSLSELPSGSKAIGTKWVFNIKQSVDGEIVRYKARLVAKGYAFAPRQGL